MTEIKYLDQPPAGWFVLDVMPSEMDNEEWAALMIDVDPDYMQARAFGTTREVFVRIPGRHSDREAACEALQDMMTARH